MPLTQAGGNETAPLSDGDELLFAAAAATNEGASKAPTDALLSTPFTAKEDDPCRFASADTAHCLRWAPQAHEYVDSMFAATQAAGAFHNTFVDGGLLPFRLEAPPQLLALLGVKRTADDDASTSADPPTNELSYMVLYRAQCMVAWLDFVIREGRPPPTANHTDPVNALLTDAGAQMKKTLAKHETLLCIAANALSVEARASALERGEWTDRISRSIVSCSLDILEIISEELLTLAFLDPRVATAREQALETNAQDNGDLDNEHESPESEFGGALPALLWLEEHLEELFDELRVADVQPWRATQFAGSILQERARRFSFKLQPWHGLGIPNKSPGGAGFVDVGLWPLPRPFLAEHARIQLSAGALADSEVPPPIEALLGHGTAQRETALCIGNALLWFDILVQCPREFVGLAERVCPAFAEILRKPSFWKERIIHIARLIDLAFNKEFNVAHPAEDKDIETARRIDLVVNKEFNAAHPAKDTHENKKKRPVKEGEEEARDMFTVTAAWRRRLRSPYVISVDHDHRANPRPILTELSNDAARLQKLSDILMSIIVFMHDPLLVCTRLTRRVLSCFVTLLIMGGPPEQHFSSGLVPMSIDVEDSRSVEAVFAGVIAGVLRVAAAIDSARVSLILSSELLQVRRAVDDVVESTDEATLEMDAAGTSEENKDAQKKKEKLASASPDEMEDDGDVLEDPERSPLNALTPYVLEMVRRGASHHGLTLERKGASEFDIYCFSNGSTILVVTDTDVRKRTGEFELMCGELYLQDPSAACGVEVTISSAGIALRYGPMPNLRRVPLSPSSELPSSSSEKVEAPAQTSQ